MMTTDDAAAMFREINTERFFAMRPDWIGRVGPWEFYEHPKHGDEIGLIMYRQGRTFRSDFYDLPAIEELEG